MRIKKQKSIQGNLRWNSTILVPKILCSIYYKLEKRHGDTREILAYLLRKYQTDQTIIFRNNDIAACLSYQEKGLNLRRIHFRPYETDWIKLRLMAFSLNMSMCALFVMLLQLEMAGLLCQNVGTPTTHSQFTLTQTLQPEIFTRILKIKPIPIFQSCLS